MTIEKDILYFTSAYTTIKKNYYALKNEVDNRIKKQEAIKNTTTLRRAKTFGLESMV